MFNKNAPQLFTPDDSAHREYEGWYIFTEPCWDLWDETNAFAMCNKLIESHGDKAAAVVSCDDGVMCIGNPGVDWDDFALVESLLSLWENGHHIDERLWGEAINERVAEYWDELSTPDRAELCLDHTGSIAGAFQLAPPDDVRDYLADVLAQS